MFTHKGGVLVLPPDVLTVTTSQNSSADADDVPTTVSRPLATNVSAAVAPTFQALARSARADVIWVLLWVGLVL